MTSPGTLFLVATPIGNLGDITLRTIETLKSIDSVVAEDTRRSRQLLSHLGITGKPIHCVDAYASPAILTKVIETLQCEKSVALLTDAGTPAVSDPGAALVARAREAGVPVIALPGPSAVTTAVAASGLVDGPFLFLGFLPRKGEKRRLQLERLLGTPEPTVFFEAPNRVFSTLTDLARLMPERRLCIARELTKKFEETSVQTLEVWARTEREWRGEFTLVLEGAPPSAEGGAMTDAELEGEITPRLERGESVRAVTDDLLPLAGLARRVLYRRILDLKSSLFSDS